MKILKPVIIFCVYSVCYCYEFKIVGDRFVHEEHKYSLLILNDSEWDAIVGEKGIDISLRNKFTAGNIFVTSGIKNKEKITDSDVQNIINEYKERNIIEKGDSVPIEIKVAEGFKILCDGPSKGEIVILQNDNFIYLFTYLTDPFSYETERDDFYKFLEGFEIIK